MPGHGGIASVKWSLTKGQNTFEFEGLEPTITIPPTESGLYVLKVTVMNLDGKVRFGQTSIYVVQDKPISVTLTSPVQFKLSAKEISPASFNKYSTGNNIEVYSGNGIWTKATKVQSDSKEIIFELMPNDSVTTFNSTVIIRPQGATHELNGYESIQVPSNLMESR